MSKKLLWVAPPARAGGVFVCQAAAVLPTWVSSGLVNCSKGSVGGDVDRRGGEDPHDGVDGGHLHRPTVGHCLPRCAGTEQERLLARQLVIVGVAGVLTTDPVVKAHVCVSFSR